MDTRTVADTVEALARDFERAGLCYGHGTDNPGDEAAALVAHVIGVHDGMGAADARRALSADELAAVERLARRRVEERVPVAYLLGHTHFAGLEFRVDERALVPRSPIGELIGNGFAPWLRPTAVHSVLDLGTGGGCIAVAVAVHLPHVQVVASDVCERALSLAAENVEQHGVGDRVRLVRSNLFDALAGERFDLIVTNPPYVSEHEFESLPPEYRHEPTGGLLAEDEGLRPMLAILARAPEHLNPGGCLIGEVGYGGSALEARLPEVPFIWAEFERGGEGVFLLEGEAVAQAADAASRELSQPEVAR